MIKPYEGSEPYIFISYAHKNTELVMPIIERMVEDGYRVWFDEGIDPGTEWTKTIATHIEKSSCMIAMMSKDYIGSDNCNDEIELARELKLPRLVIYLSETQLTTAFRMTINRIQAVHKYKYINDDDFYNKLYEAEMLKYCKHDTKIPAEEITYRKALSAYNSDNFKKSRELFVSISGWKNADEMVIKCDGKLKEPIVSKKRKYDIKRFVIIAAIIAAILAVIFLRPRLLYGSNGDGTCYVATIRGLYDESLEIPMYSPDGDKITGIGNNAFYNCYDITSVTLPESITIIGAGSFYCTGLTSITIPNSVTSIGSYAFQGCRSITSVTIPDSVTSVGYGIFDNCIKLQSVEIGSGIKGITYGMFVCCNSLERVTMSDDIKSIGELAFYGCTSLTSIELPEKLENIGTNAFQNCQNLESINIPNSVTQINQQAFDGCYKLKDIYFEGTQDDWSKISKGTNWDLYTPSYTIHCSNGDITK